MLGVVHLLLVDEPDPLIHETVLVGAVGLQHRFVDGGLDLGGAACAVPGRGGVDGEHVDLCGVARGGLRRVLLAEKREWLLRHRRLELGHERARVDLHHDVDAV